METKYPYHYIAVPYSTPDDTLRYERYLEVTNFCAELLRANIMVYSPITHCHDMAEKFSLPTDFYFWEQYNKTMLYHADQFTILALDGWHDSIGVTNERDYAKTFGKAINIVKLCETASFIDLQTYKAGA